jgi:hypothetical protein
MARPCGMKLNDDAPPNSIATHMQSNPATGRSAGGHTLGSALTHIERDRSTDQIVALYKKFADQPFIAPGFRTEHLQAIARKAVRLIRDPVIIFGGRAAPLPDPGR